MLCYCSLEEIGNTFVKRWWAHLALMRYWARLMLAGVPVMVIWRSDDPSMALAILICAPDIWRISLILVPWRPIMQPISWEESGKVLKGLSKRKHSLCYRKYASFSSICNGIVLWQTTKSCQNAILFLIIWKQGFKELKNQIRSHWIN